MGISSEAQLHAPVAPLGPLRLRPGGWLSGIGRDDSIVEGVGRLRSTSGANRRRCVHIHVENGRASAKFVRVACAQHVALACIRCDGCGGK